MLIKVKNIPHSGDHTPNRFGFSSWKDYWEANMDQNFGLCAASDCLEHAAVGGHVMRVGNYSKRWYIVPLCKGCNDYRNEEPFYVDGSLLYPANP